MNEAGISCLVFYVKSQGFLPGERIIGFVYQTALSAKLLI